MTQMNVNIENTMKLYGTINARVQYYISLLHYDQEHHVIGKHNLKA